MQFPRGNFSMGLTDCVSWKPRDIKKNHLINAMSLACPREAVKRLSFSCILL